jgi:hypothetical protein
MKANMKFKPEEWNKLTSAQKAQILVVKGLPPRPNKPSPAPLEANVHDVQPVLPPVVPASSYRA